MVALDYDIEVLALSGGACCGFRYQQASVEDFQTAAPKSSNTSKVETLQLRLRSRCYSGGRSLLRSVSAVLCRSPERLGRKQRDEEVGDWESGLLFCHITVTVKTMFPMNEDGRSP